MFEKLLLAIGAGLGTMAATAAAQAPVAADYVVENVNVVPMTGEMVLRDQVVAIKDGKILALAPVQNAPRFSAPMRIDGNGRYLMPGLADMHVHVRWAPQAMFNLFLVNGVTTVANMGLADGGGDIDHLKLRSDVAAGTMAGPRYLVSGPQLDAEEVPNPDSVPAILDDHERQGFDFVKIHGDIDPVAFDTLIRDAAARQLKVTGHIQHLAPLSSSLRMNSIEHAEEFLYSSPDPDFAEAAAEEFLSAYRANAARLRDAEYRQRIARDVAASGAWVKPTLIVYKMVGEWASDERLAEMSHDRTLRYLPAEVRDRWLNPASNPYQEADFPIPLAELLENMQLLLLLTGDLHQAGVPLLLGTDGFGTLLPGFSVHRELALLVAAGLSPYEALRTGTVNVAAYLGEADRAGSIGKGKRADFLLLDGNPLEDVANAARISGLFTRGRWFSQGDLQRLRDQALQEVAN